MPGWHGVFPYLATALRADGSLQADAQATLVRRVLDAGVHGVTPLGSTGEYPYLRRSVRRATIEAVVGEVAGAVPVVAGIGGLDAAEAADEARDAQRAGADGLLAILQAYFPISDDGIVAWFERVAAATDLPVVVYHHPIFCNLRLSVPTIERLAAIENVRYVKESSGTSTIFEHSPQLRERGVELFAATAFSPTASMLFGAVGWMSGPASVFPAFSVRHYELCRAGRWEDAVALEREFESVLQMFLSAGPAASVKALLRADGIDVGHPLRGDVRDAQDLVSGDELARIRERLAAALRRVDDAAAIG